MNAELLLNYYEQIADAPDAVARLRQFILDLAVRGKLVPQDPNDEPASELFKQITAEKARLTKTGEFRAQQRLAPVQEYEKPFQLPDTWMWIRVGDAFEYDAGMKRDPKELNAEKWLLELEDIEKDTSTILNRLRVKDRDSLSTKSEFVVGDILYGKLRPYLNKVVVADEPGYSTTEIVAIRPFLPLCSEYCALAFRRPDFVEYVTLLGRGTKMPRLRTPDAIVALFPLSPLAEQRRIVARVDELMGLCDQLEQARADREDQRDRLATATLAQLSQPTEEPSAFREHAAFALEHLAALTARPDQVKALRQVILNVAVRGKLVPQDSSEAHQSKFTIHALLERDADGGLYRIPFNWIWIDTELVADVVDPQPSHRTPPQVPNGIPYIGMGDVRQDSSLNFENARKVHPDIFREHQERYKLQEGDFIFGKIGTIGKPIKLPKPFNYTLSANIVLIQPHQDLVDPEYIYWYMSSPALEYVLHSSSRITTHAAFGIKRIRKLPVPVPPLAEQHRIVAKVDELMALCDRLEASLAAGDGARRRLLDAVLHAALEPAAVVGVGQVDAGMLRQARLEFE